MPRLILSLMFASFLTASTVAAPATKPATQLPLPGVQSLIDENTFLLVAIDVTAVDPEALVTWSTTLLKQSGSAAKDVDGATYVLRSLAGPARKWGTDFTRAGGRYLFFVASTDPKTPMFFVTPIPQRGNPQAVANLMKSPFGVPLPGGFIPVPQPGAKPKPGDPPAPPPERAGGPAATAAGIPWGYHVDRVGDAIVVGDAAALKQAHVVAAKPNRTARPELTDALVGVETGGIRAAFAMTAGLRDLLKGFGPNLPYELGGEPTSVLTEKLKWATLSIDLPAGRDAKATLRLTAQGTDADSAKRLGNVITGIIRTAVNDGELAKHPDRDRFLKMFESSATGDRAVVTFDQSEITASAGILGPLAIKARAKAARAQSEKNLKQIVGALRNYAGEFGGRFPKTLEDPQLLKYLGDTPAKAKEALVNPMFPDRGVGYVMLKPTPAMIAAKPMETILVHEAYDKWPAEGILAGYVAGHVKEIKAEAELRR